MKPLRFLLTLFCVASYAAHAQTSANLVSYYKFNNNLADSSGNGYHLSSTDTYVFTSGRTNTANECFYFDTTLAHPEGEASVSGITQLNDQELTIAFWIKPSLNMLDNGIKNVHRGYTTGSGLYSWGIEQYPYSSGGGNKTRASSDSVGLDCYIYHTNFAEYRYVTMIIDTQWNHVAFTFKANDSIRAYRNGVLIDSLTTAFPFGSLADVPDKLFFGHSNPSYHSAFTKLDDYQLYNKQLSTSDVQQLYQNSIPTAITKVTAYKALSVYPNPCRTHCCFQVEENGASVQLYSMQGQLLQSFKAHAGTHSMDMHTMPTGAYILKVQSGNKNDQSILTKE